jgi:hypothetical protein
MKNNVEYWQNRHKILGIYHDDAAERWLDNHDKQRIKKRIQKQVAKQNIKK